MAGCGQEAGETHSGCPVSTCDLSGELKHDPEVTSICTPNSSNRDGVVTWHIVYAFNLLLPVFLGMMKTDGMARLGLLTGIVLFWFVGWSIVARSIFLGTALNWGAILVALCQMFLIVHLFYGMSAFLISKQLDAVQSGELVSFLSGLTATCIMGGCLMLTSFLIGFVEITLSGFFYYAGFNIIQIFVNEQAYVNTRSELSATDERDIQH